MFHGIIYCATNLMNGKQYVGQTKYSLKLRWSCHIWQSKNASICAIHRAIRKYGLDSFKVEQIDFADSLDELNKKEALHILRLKTLVPGGYNLTTGGDVCKVSEETRKKQSEAGLGKVRGPFSEEHRRKLAEAKIGVPLSEECKRKISAANLGKVHGPHSKESKQKISEANLGKVHGPHSEETRQKIAQALRSRPKKTYCKRGHLYDENSTYTNPNTGNRACLVCYYLNHAFTFPSKLLYLLSETEKQTLFVRPKKTHCCHGHLLDEINTYIYQPTGQCRCRACHYLNHGLSLPPKLQYLLQPEVTT